MKKVHISIKGSETFRDLWFDFLPREGELIVEGERMWRVVNVSHNAATGKAVLVVVQV